MDQIEANSQSLLRPYSVTALLGEHIEQTRQHARQDSDPIVANGYNCVTVLLAGRQRDLATVQSISCRIVQQIGEYLLKAHTVSIDEQRRFRYGNVQRMLLFADEGLACFNDVTKYGSQFRGRTPEFGFPTRDA